MENQNVRRDYNFNLSLVSINNAVILRYDFELLLQYIVFTDVRFN